MAGGDLVDEFPFVAPPPRELLPTRLKKTKGDKGEHHVGVVVMSAMLKTTTSEGKNFYPSAKEGYLGHHYVSRGA